jgi:hypothetical protein
MESNEISQEDLEAAAGYLPTLRQSVIPEVDLTTLDLAAEAAQLEHQNEIARAEALLAAQEEEEKGKDVLTKPLEKEKTLQNRFDGIEMSQFVRKVIEVASISFEPQDFDICQINGGAYGLVLRWPFIEITNRNGQRHSIKDMLVGLPFNSPKKEDMFMSSSFDLGIYGGRGTLTPAEYRSNYRHSHLGRGVIGMSAFCTGLDDINVSWTDLKMISSDKDGFKMHLESFLHQINSFIRYESLEGVPYVRMNSISLNNNHSLANYIIEAQVKTYREKFDESNIQISFDFNSGNVELIENDAFHSDLASIVQAHQKRLPNGDYVNLDLENDGSGLGGFHIDGSEYYLNGVHKCYVEKFQFDEESLKNIKKYAHKNIIDDVKRKFKSSGEQIVKKFCEDKRIRNEDEEKGSSSDWPVFNGGHNLLLVEEAG